MGVTQCAIRYGHVEAAEHSFRDAFAYHSMRRYDAISFVPIT